MWTDQELVDLGVAGDDAFELVTVIPDRVVAGHTITGSTVTSGPTSLPWDALVKCANQLNSDPERPTWRTWVRRIG